MTIHPHLTRLALLLTCGCICLLAGAEAKFDYRVLSTSKTSSMEKEMNDAGEVGFHFSGVMGGETAFGGKEVLVVMAKPSGEPVVKHRYKLLATSKTSTLQKELQVVGDEGFDYCGQTIFVSAFGGKEVSVILEQALTPEKKVIEYKVLATSKTSTMQKELQLAGDDGFSFLGVVVGKTAMGGNEVVSILRKYGTDK